MVVLHKVRGQPQLAKLVGPENFHEESAFIPVHLRDHNDNVVQMHRLNAECHGPEAPFPVPFFNIPCRERQEHKTRKDGTC
jgi:hypothetical protein